MADRQVIECNRCGKDMVVDIEVNFGVCYACIEDKSNEILGYDI